MSTIAQDSPKNPLPDKVRRELKKGETIYHSNLPCHVSVKYPEGKWIAQVRRDERGKLVKYPVKGFGIPREALDYIKSLRPDAHGRVASARQGEPTVASLYEFVRTQRQKRISESSKQVKEIRWRLYIEPEWGDCPLSQLTRRAAQEWVTEVESRIEQGRAGTLGLAQFEKVRTDLHAMFECISSFSPSYEDRKNPFAGLDFSARAPRLKVTIESQHFAAVARACRELAKEGLCTNWISQIFLTSLFSGLREGEVLALCRDQIDLRNGAIVVDRAVRRQSRAIDPKTRQEVGPVLRLAMNLPKGGSASNDKTRVVPVSDQLAEILRPVLVGAPVDTQWNLLWPGETGKIREGTRFRTAWKTLRERLHELATLAPIEDGEEPWPGIEKRQGWPRNPLVNAARAKPDYRVPNVFQDIDFRDTRNSFASYANEVGLSQATREHVLGHGSGLTNKTYTVVTSATFQDARKRLTTGWKPLP